MDYHPCCDTGHNPGVRGLSPSDPWRTSAASATINSVSYLQRMVIFSGVWVKFGKNQLNIRILIKPLQKKNVVW